MKICISATQPNLEAEIDQRFGRCAYFVVYDTETKQHHAFENNNVSAAGGAGITSAKNVIDAGAEAVITGNCGPNAVKTLIAGNVKLYVSVRGTVAQAIENFIAGKLTESKVANVDSHFGSGM